MSRTGNALVIGGTPLAHLLPPEIAAERRARANLRVLVFVLAVIVLVVVAGVGLASWRAVESQLALDAERQRTAELLSQQLPYSEARALATQVDLAIEGRARGTETEIDWKAYLDELAATLPAGMTITSVGVASISPVEPVLTSTVPLSQDWVASLAITARSASIPHVETWLANLESLTGFAGVAPPVTVAGDPTIGYDISAEVRVNSDAFLLRFQKEEAN